jgi:hypothetical protein
VIAEIVGSELQLQDITLTDPHTGSALNEVYRETEDIRKTIQRTGLSFDVVWDMTGMKDYFDFEETEWKE